MTPGLPTTITLFYFCAGELRLGIVAAAVAQVAPCTELDSSPAQCPHIGKLLKLECTGEVTDRRIIVIACGGRSARLVVDGPIRLTRIGARDLLPLSLGLRHRPLVGFAQDGQQLVILLHIAWLVETACCS